VSLISLAGLLVVACSDVPRPSQPGESFASTPPLALPTAGVDASFEPGSTAAIRRTVRYVALGDSYTIGTGLPRARERWPNQLVRVLAPDVRLQLAANLAVNSATAQTVISGQLQHLREFDPEFVSLLIGVNDVIGVFRTDPVTYRFNLDLILDAILDEVPPDRVLLVTTPDYTLTPHGNDYSDEDWTAAQASAEIADFNALVLVEGASRGVAVVDISPVSNRVLQDPSLLARDELHPSGKQYAGWVELIAPTVRTLLTSGR
jgi:lysophospholipase L1-like esterase